VGKSLDRCRAEARKCALVCANCHGEVEAGLIESPPPLGEEWGTPPSPPACAPSLPQPGQRTLWD
jgi:hypothetical protein